MNQLSEEQRARVQQIRERWPTGTKDDIDFLLCLLDSQTAGIPYCLNCWHAVPYNGPAGIVDDACTHEGCNCGYYQPARSTDAATAMRDACVEKVKAETPDSWLDPLLTGPQAVIGKPPYDCKDVERLLQAVSKRTVTALQSLTLEAAATTQKDE